MKKWIRWMLVLLIAGVAFTGFIAFQWFKPSNLIVDQREIFIDPNDNYDSLIQKINPNKCFSLPAIFNVTAEYMNLPNFVYPGKYVLTSDESIIAVIRKLRSGQSEDIKIVLRPTLKRKALISYLSEELYTDEDELRHLLANPIDGYNKDNYLDHFYGRYLFF